MPTQDERILQLEKEVKNLNRLMREAAAREKVLTTRLKLLGQDHAQTLKRLKELETAAKKIDGKLTQVERKK